MIVAYKGQAPNAYQPSFSNAPSSSTTLATQVATPASSHVTLNLYTPPPSPSTAAYIPMRRSRKYSIGVLITIISFLTLSLLSLLPEETRGQYHEYYEDSAWIVSSSSWIDRQACHWLHLCGVMHLFRTHQIHRSLLESNQQKAILESRPDYQDSRSFWTSGLESPEEWSAEERHLRQIPQYVYDHTPYVHLFSGEEFWPCDIAEHLVHTSPYLNYTQIRAMKNDRTLDNLDQLNSYGRYTYLQSEDDVEGRPDWLGGSQNIPTNPEDTDTDRSRPRNDWNEKATQAHDEQSKGHYHGGHSSAPAVLIVVPKENGIVDAFWFYFYSYNLGNKVLNVRFGNHVGDWEHSMVRFQNGTPEVVYISEHGAGQAYSYQAVEKIGKRPVIYSATGTHAMYATAGPHPYVLPWGLLHDQTDRGPLWDPLLNNHAFVYNHTSRVIKSSAQTPHAPVNWFNYRGRWGDKYYPLSDPRQYRFLGQYHYVSGPLGPRFKNLGRKKACQRRDGQCVIKHWLGDDKKAKSWSGTGPGENVETKGYK